jgi:hypothetical protein
VIVCSQIIQKPVEPQVEDDLNMESQLNPDAAEFVPSPTQVMPSMEDILLAQPSSRGITVKDAPVPSQTEFQREVVYHPSEVELAGQAAVFPESKMPSALLDLITTEEGSSANPFISSSNQLDCEEVSSKNPEKTQEQEMFSEQQNIHKNIDVQELTLDGFEVTSTKAELFDDSASGLTIGPELQKTVTECASLLPSLEKSFGDLDLQETGFMPYLAKSDNNIACDDNELSRINENEFFMNESKAEETAPRDGGSIAPENEVSSYFEVQKELVPEVEFMLERVKLESEDTSSPDDSGSPLQAEGKQPEDSASLSQVPYLPVSSPVPDLSPVVAEEQAVTAQTQEPSLQDLTATVSYPAECPASSPEAEIFTPEQFSTPNPQSSLLEPAAPVLTTIPEIVSPLVDMWSKPSMLQGSETFQFQNPQQSNHFEPSFDMPAASDLYSERDLLEREQVTATPGSVDPFGSIESTFKITDSNHHLKEDLSSEIASSVFEQHPVLRKDEETPIYDEVLRNTVSTSEDGNQETLPVSHIPVEPPMHSVKAETEECGAIQIPPPAPDQVPAEIPQLSSVEPPTAQEEPVQVSENVGGAVNEGSFVAAAVVGTAVLAGVAAAQDKPSDEVKAPEKNLSKKPTTAEKKEATAAKVKAAKTSISNKTAASPTGAARMLQKSKPSSPAKPPSTTLHSSAPKKLATVTPPASKATKSSAPTNKPKPGATSPVKPLPSALKSTGVGPRVPSSATSTKSASVSNGDVSKPAVTKKTSVSATAKVQSRPSTAPATTRTVTAKQMGTVTSRANPTSTVSPQLKSATANVGASKPRSAGTVTTRTISNKVGSVSDTKLAANRQKQMPAAHTVPNRTVTVASAHSTTKPAARRVVSSVTKTTVISSTGKVGPKKTTSSMPNSGSHAATTASTKTTKTEVTVTSMAIENNK